MEPQPFLFGKLPAHGDFVMRGLSEPERDAWDAWGAEALSALRGAAGEAFEDVHGAAPPWRFVVGGEAGWRAGALSPSVDNVGRRYLLAVGAGSLPGPVAGACGLLLTAAAETLIYDALAQGLTADAVIAEARVRFSDICLEGGAAAAALSAIPAAGAWWTLGSETSGPIALSATQAPTDLFVRGAPVASMAVMM